MRLLLVTQYFWPENFRVNDMVEGLVAAGHDVTVLTGFPNYPYGKIYPGYKKWKLFQRETYKGAQVVRVWLHPDHTLSIIQRLLNYGSFALTASLLGPFLTGLGFDRIIVFQPGPFSVGFPAILYKLLMRVPALIWVQDVWPDGLRDSGVVKNEKLLKMVGWFAQKVYAFFDKVMISSPGFKEPLVRMKVDPQRICFLPQWSEDLYQMVAPDEALRAAEGMVGRFNVMFAGNIGLIQNLEVVLDVADRLRGHPDIHFVIVGDGLRLEPLKDAARQLRLDNVTFKGRRPLEAMPPLFALADALLVQLKKSPIYNLTIPGKLQSYLACGRPVVAALEGAGAQIVREAKAGVACEPDNPQALTAAVLALYRLPPEERQKMGLAGKTYYDRTFARSVVMDRLSTLISH